MQDLEFILDMHNQTRSLFPDANRAGHFVNENTVIRVAALMDAMKLRPRRLPDASAKMTDAEVCQRTLFLLRHFIIHLEGRYLPDCLKRESKPLNCAYSQFCVTHPEARVAVGRPLCLAGREVLTPLIEGCIAYDKERRGL